VDRFSGKGKQLMMELKKIPECNAEMMKKDMETLVDQWLDVSLTSGGDATLVQRINSKKTEILSASSINNNQ